MPPRGERFDIDLPLDEQRQADLEGVSAQPTASAFVPGFVKDIQERHTSTVNPPAPPTLRATSTGFPAHKKRTGVSRFKQQRDGLTPPDTRASAAAVTDGDAAGNLSTDAAVDGADFIAREKREIDAENRQKLAQWSDEEIERERQELLNTLSPEMIQMLLQRANIDDPNSNAATQQYPEPPNHPESSLSHGETNAELQSDKGSQLAPENVLDATASGLGGGENDPTSRSQAINSDAPDLASQVHFPKPPDPPKLDPSSSTFFADLHEKYFPDLPNDPSKLAWMADPSPSEEDEDTSYSPAQPSISVSALRFSFRGQLLAPRTAKEIPVTKGLHHHGDAPESAGYTLPELARLSRSAFPAQRCMAYQTLGRVLYRLGKGEFGPHGSDLASGLWRCIQDGRVLDTLSEEANQQGGHASAKAHAQEALWNWQKGGGQRWQTQ